MLIESLKFLHILLILSLTGATVYCLALASSATPNQTKIHLLNRYILWTATFAIITGSLLVYPKHFTFHTEWVQTAYVLVLVFGGTLALCLWATKKNLPLSRQLWLVAYLFLAIILALAIHDAVTKTPLINLAFLSTPAK